VEVCETSLRVAKQNLNNDTSYGGLSQNTIFHDIVKAIKLSLTKPYNTRTLAQPHGGLFWAATLVLAAGNIYFRRSRWESTSVLGYAYTCVRVLSWAVVMFVR